MQRAPKFYLIICNVAIDSIHIHFYVNDDDD